jgi:serine/threonine-protein kinase
VKLAVSPWGEVEIDGTAYGTAPPLTQVTLSEGKHRVVVRNGDYPAYSTSIEVRRGTPVALKHKFGS